MYLLKITHAQQSFSLSLSLSVTHIAKTAGTGKLQAKAPPNNNNGQQDTHLQDNAALENS